MTIVAISKPRVKPTRNTPRRPGRFGAGLLRSLPTDRRNHTASDEAWAAQSFGDAERSFHRDVDRHAAMALAQDRMDRGFCPF